MKLSLYKKRDSITTKRGLFQESKVGSILENLLIHHVNKTENKINLTSLDEEHTLNKIQQTFMVKAHGIY